MNNRYVWVLHAVILVLLLSCHCFNASLNYVLAVAFFFALHFLDKILEQQLGAGRWILLPHG